MSNRIFSDNVTMSDLPCMNCKISPGSSLLYLLLLFLLSRPQSGDGRESLLQRSVSVSDRKIILHFKQKTFHIYNTDNTQLFRSKYNHSACLSNVFKITRDGKHKQAINAKLLYYYFSLNLSILLFLSNLSISFLSMGFIARISPNGTTFMNTDFSIKLSPVANMPKHEENTTIFLC